MQLYIVIEDVIIYIVCSSIGTKDGAEHMDSLELH